MQTNQLSFDLAPHLQLESFEAHRALATPLSPLHYALEMVAVPEGSRQDFKPRLNMRHREQIIRVMHEIGILRRQQAPRSFCNTKQRVQALNGC